MLSVLIKLKLLTDKGVEVMIIKKGNLQAVQHFSPRCISLFFLGNVVAMTDAGPAFDVTFSLLLD